MNNSQYVTKKDLDETVDRIVTEVGEIIGDALQMISHRFDEQDRKTDSIQADVRDLQTSVNRIENKLDATIAQVDDHEVKIRKLQAKLA